MNKQEIKEKLEEARRKHIEKEIERRRQEAAMPYLKPDELKDGYLYKIYARNARYGIWKKERGSFFISRIKFGHNYIFEEIHWDLSDAHGTVKPLEEIEKAPFSLWEEMGMAYVTINGVKKWCYTLESEMLEYLNQFEGDRFGRR